MGNGAKSITCDQLWQMCSKIAHYWLSAWLLMFCSGARLHRVGAPDCPYCQCLSYPFRWTDTGSQSLHSASCRFNSMISQVEEHNPLRPRGWLRTCYGYGGCRHRCCFQDGQQNGLTFSGGWRSYHSVTARAVNKHGQFLSAIENVVNRKPQKNEAQEDRFNVY